MCENARVFVCVREYVCVSMLVYFFPLCITPTRFTSSTRRRGMCRKLSNNFNLTCVCKSGKHSLMLRKTSLFNCEHIEPFIHESFDVPSLLCSHSDVSLSLTFAIFTFARKHTAHIKFSTSDGRLFYCSAIFNEYSVYILVLTKITHTHEMPVENCNRKLRLKKVLPQDIDKCVLIMR